MPIYQYYSRKSVSGTETEFFDVSMSDATNKELDTNILKERKVIKDFAVDRIIVNLPIVERYGNTSQSDKVITDHKALVNEGVIVIKIGDEAEKYYRLAECLDNLGVFGAFNLKEPADATTAYQIASVYPVNGEKGREADFTIPAETNIVVTLKTVSEVSGIDVVLIFSGTE